MIEELEDEVAEMRAIALRAGANQLKKLEDENKKIAAELADLNNRNEELQKDNSELLCRFVYFRCFNGSLFE
jgi:transcriptional/translational regulatory protein YebC/TACO1